MNKKTTREIELDQISLLFLNLSAEKNFKPIVQNAVGNCCKQNLLL